MKRSSLPTFVFLILALFTFQTVSAQINIKIPKLPKRDQPKPQPSPPAESESAEPASTDDAEPAQPAPPESRNTPKPSSGSRAAAPDHPTIEKNSIQLTAFTDNFYKGNYDNWSWLPLIEFIVNGPIASGSQLYVEVSMPGASPWVRFDCRTEEVQPGRYFHTHCGGRDNISEDKSSTYTGVVNFAIKMRNELAGSDSTLFTGKAKVAKVHSNLVGPKAVNKFVWYVDQDWTLPIGYVYLVPDSQKGMQWPEFNLAFWVRGDPYNFQPHLFYQGKEVGKIFYDNDEVGKASCGADIELTTTQYVAESVPQKAKWSRIKCTFPNVRGWNKTGEPPGMFGPLYELNKNPGEYEFKLLWNNHLARSIKFKVDANGLADNGIATNNKLGDDRIIVPVQIIGDQDGVWDKAAWKTDAFYGNPLTGFTALP